jgi:hypothetical protein
MPGDFTAGDAIFLAAVPPTPADDDESIAVTRQLRDQGIPLLADNWHTHVSVDADMLLGIDSMPRSSRENRRHDAQESGAKVAGDGGPATIISGLADATTPGLEALLDSRQARGLQQTATPARRHTSTPQLAGTTATILLGSKPNGLPAGLALHAELRALQAAGLRGEQVLHAAGRNPARALGLDNQIGIITPGALADMILVSGDPLNDVDDALKIVAVVRNGRFFSLVRLLEQASTAASVE